MELWHRLVDVSSDNPETVRRSRMLNTILIWLLIATLAILAYYVVAIIKDPAVQNWDPGFSLLYSIFGFLILNLIIYGVGRRWPNWANILFLVLFTTMLFFSDNAVAVISGRSTLYFAIPIILSSVLLRPSASIATTLYIIVVHTAIAYENNETFNAFSSVGYVLIALISWLTTHNLDRALFNLRKANLELDQRVADRTRELSQALLNVQAEASKNQAIVQSITDGVIVFDTDGRILAANQALANLTGKSPSQITGRGIDAWIRAAAPASEVENIRTLFNGTTSTPTNIDWGSKTLTISVAPVQPSSGPAIGAVAIFHDITREVEISRMKTTFVAMVSHELRTPLSAILGMAEILQTNMYGPLNEKQESVLHRILTNSQKLNRLVADLLDQAQIEAGTLSIQNDVFAPADMLNSVKELTYEAAQAKGLGLETILDDNLPDKVVGDVHRINQVLTNLVMNAIKFTRQGQVRVHGYQSDETHWALAVSDTGPGIPADAQAQVFEPFKQLDSSISRQHGGVGLGLSIVKKLVTLMQGEISLVSQVGAGSTFTVVLPLVLPDPETAQEIN